MHLPDYAANLARLGTSTLADAVGGKGCVAIPFRRLSGEGAVAGRAATAQCMDGSSRAVGRAVGSASAGDILCISAPFETAAIGDLIGTEIARTGMAAVILDGFARDSALLAQSPVSFFVRGLCPVAQKTLNPGEIGVPLSLGGVTIHPGDWVVADDDGVMVIPADEVDGVIQIANAIAEREERILARIQSGTPIAEAFAAEAPTNP